MAFKILLTLASVLAFTYDEDLAKELTALTFATKCSEEALTEWNVGYVSRNYPDVTNIVVLANETLATKGYIAYNKKR